MSETDDGVEELAVAARDTAVPILQLLRDLLPAIAEKYGGDACFRDNIILQALILNICAHTVGMIQATHRGGLSMEKTQEINLDISQQIGRALQDIFAKYLGCDAVIVGKTVHPKGEGGGP